MLKCMKILRLALILLLFFNCFCFAKEIKFIHITDINLSYNADEINELYRTVKEINNYPDIDFVVFGGNNIAKANVENLELIRFEGEAADSEYENVKLDNVKLVR